MTIEYFILKFGRYLTLGLAIIFLLFKYYPMPDLVAVNYDSNSNPSGFLPKDQFFYLITSLFFGINIFMPILTYLFKKNKIGNMPFFNKKFAPIAIIDLIENWINLIVCLINTLILLSILVIAKLNSTEYHSKIVDFGWLQTMFLGAALIILLYPILKIFIIKNTTEVIS